jgi:hypothetical protein
LGLTDDGHNREAGYADQSQSQELADEICGHPLIPEMKVRTRKKQHRISDT